MRIPVKIILAGLGIGYAGLMTKVSYEQHKQIIFLKLKLKKSKKKAKKYRKELEKPIYRRTILPRNAKAVPKPTPKNPIGFC